MGAQRALPRSLEVLGLFAVLLPLHAALAAILTVLPGGGAVWGVLAAVAGLGILVTFRALQVRARGSSSGLARLLLAGFLVVDCLVLGLGHIAGVWLDAATSYVVAVVLAVAFCWGACQIQPAWGGANRFAARTLPLPLGSATPDPARVSTARPACLEVVERPTTTFADVVGMDGPKQDLREAIHLMLHPELLVSHGLAPLRGLLLYGPPGTGKTFFALAAAGEFRRAFYYLNGATLKSKYHGEQEKELEAAFRYARENAPSILFIDELDDLGMDRSSIGEGASFMRGHVNALLKALDGLEAKNTQFLVLAATNRIDMLDVALLRPGRFDRKVLVGLPNRADRRRLLELLVSKRPRAGDLDLDAVAAQTEGWSQAALKGLVDEAARRIYREAPSRPPRPLRTGDLLASMPAVA